MKTELGFEIHKEFLHMKKGKKGVPDWEKKPIQKPRVLERQLVDQVSESYAELGK